MRRHRFKKSLTLLSVLVVLQPSILNAEAITLAKNEEVEQSENKELESSSEVIPETTKEGTSEELQETDESLTIEESATENHSTTSDTDSTHTETEGIKETDSEETEESEEMDSSEQDENSPEAKEEAEKKAFDAMRAEGRANYPEKNKDQIIEALPGDAITLSDVFDTDAFSNVSEATAHIETTPSGSDVVFMTEAGQDGNGGAQSSALWSTEDFKVDMTKTFEAEMYVYLGNSRLGSADGMTFTFQNDSRKTKAIGKQGGGLGVYGNVDKKRPGGFLGGPGSSLENFLKESVQKSFTIEMDTTANEVFDGGSYKASSWGQALKKEQHVLAAYPGLSEFSTFKKEKFIGLIDTGRWKKSDNEPQYKMVTKDWLATGFSKWQPYMQNNAVATPIFTSSTSNTRGPWLSDGLWHKLEIKYTPKDRRSASSKYTVDAPELLVTFDGKTKDYTGRFSPFANGLVSESDPYMYWGLTAATGQTASTQAVAFKKLPKTSGVTHVADIKKGNKSIIGTGEYTHVQSGDVLSYESTSIFKSGNNEFEKPVYVNTIASGVEYVADSFEVKEPGSNQFIKVPASDYDVGDGQLVYHGKNNLSKPKPTMETRFKVKVKPTYYETLIEEESRLSSSETFLIARQDLAYIIDPIDVVGKVSLDDLTDNPDITKAITGKMTTEKAYANKEVTVNFYGDKEATKIEPVKLTLDSKGAGTIKGVLEKHLTAEKVVDVIVQDDQGDVIAVGQGKVADKTAPTADEKPLEYFVVENIKELPFVAEQLLENIQDSNPNLSVREETGADITATFMNEAEIIKGLAKIGTVDGKIELKDRYDNKREYTVPIHVLENRLKVSVKDSTVQLGEIATVVDGNISLKPQDSIEDIIEDKSNVEIHFIERDATQTELDPEDLKTAGKGNAYYYEGLIKPAVGKYPLILKVEYKATEIINGDEKVVTVKNEMPFTMTVVDKPLSLTAEGELSAETPISNNVEDIELTGDFKVKVKKSSLSPGKWTLAAMMEEPFEDSQGNSGYPLSLVYYKKGSMEPVEVTAIKIDSSDVDEKEYDFSEAAGENFFRIRTGEASSAWASKGETYSATVTWVLAGSQSKALEISDQLTAKGK